MDLPEMFARLDEAAIDRFIAEGQEEHLLLDFKTISRTDFTSSDDRRNYAKALAGFANSSGGLIVWGVDARKTKPDAPDVAVERREIEPLSLLLSRLNEFSGSFVRPTVEGVQHRAIPVSRDKGFAVTLVPESEAGPHMAMGGEGRYYKRSGASFYPMEHFDIADMFARRHRPVLSLVSHVTQEGSSGINLNIKIALGITNSGRGIAKHLYLAPRVQQPYKIDQYGLDGNRRDGMGRLLGATWDETRYGGDAGLVVHPGHTHFVTAIRIVVRSDRTQALDDLNIDYDIASEDHPLERKSFILPGERLLREALGR